MATLLEYALNGLMGVGRTANWAELAGPAVKARVDALAAECGEAPDYAIAGTQYVERMGVVIIIFADVVFRVRQAKDGDYFGEGATWRALPQVSDD